MLRLMTAAVLLAIAAAPAFACDFNRSVSRDDSSNAVASQSPDEQAAPASGTSAERSPS